MRWRKSFEGLDALVAERGDALLATAVLLTGSRTAAEDLLQAGLERLMRQALIQALATLPPRQRAVLVLRYWEQCSEAEAAEILDCSVGTVKSTTSRGLARLREITASWAADDAPAWNGAGK